MKSALHDGRRGLLMEHDAKLEALPKFSQIEDPPYGVFERPLRLDDVVVEGWLSAIDGDAPHHPRVVDPGS